MEQPKAPLVVADKQSMASVPQGQLVQQQYIFVLPSSGSGEYPDYNRNISRSMGALQLLMAASLIIINTAMAYLHFNDVWILSAGWWATPFQILAGSWGFYAGYYPTRWPVLITFVFSTISCITIMGVAAQGAFDLAIGCTLDVCSDTSQIEHYILTSLFLFCGVGEFGFALTQAIFAGDVYFKHRSPQPPPGPVERAFTNGGFVPNFDAKVPLGYSKEQEANA